MFFRRKSHRSFARRRPRFIRRRFSRFKRFRSGGRRTNSYTAQRGSAVALRFRGRRISRRAWRGSLFRSTRHKAHYRSIGIAVNSGSTGGTQGFSSPDLHFAVGGLSVPTAFWTTGGGLQAYDLTSPTPPLFQDDLIIRGGKVSLHVSVPATVVDAVAIRVWWIRTVKNAVAGATAIGPLGIQPYGWDPSTLADFDRIVGSIIHTSEAVLNPDNSYATFEIRVPIQKANQVDWLQGGPQILYAFQTTNLSSNTSVPINWTSTWNLSFSGDANGISPALAVANREARRSRHAAASDASSDVTMSTRRVK